VDQGSIIEPAEPDIGREVVFAELMWLGTIADHCSPLWGYSKDNKWGRHWRSEVDRGRCVTSRKEIGDSISSMGEISGRLPRGVIGRIPFLMDQVKITSSHPLMACNPFLLIFFFIIDDVRRRVMRCNLRWSMRGAIWREKCFVENWMNLRPWSREMELVSRLMMWNDCEGAIVVAW
jgi:hypothetical protein